ncbi:MAG: hypothetical protein RIG61_02675 [Deltaproteobacteria bacterium]
MKKFDIPYYRGSYLKILMKKMKVLIYGIPKTGTTILTYKISSALGESTQVIFEPKVRDKSIEKPGNIVTKCLFGFDPSEWYTTPETIEDYYNYEKKIWITRDPRDVIISSFLYQWFKGHDPQKESFKNALEAVKMKEENPNSIPFSVLDRIKINGMTLNTDELKNYHTKMNSDMFNLINKITRYRFISKILKRDWFIFKYEDLIDNKIEKLNEYLGFSIDDEADIPKKFGRVKRSKAYGNWRDWFTPEDVEFYKPLYHEYMQLVNYDTNDWRLNDNPVLSPELGSKYMEKLFYGEN